MNATVLTTIIGLVIAAIGTIWLPGYLDRKKHSEAEVADESVDSRAVARMFKEERDRLQLRLDVMQAEHERQLAAFNADNARRIAEVEAAWKAQHERDQAQIADLRAELYGVYRQLNQPLNQPPSQR